MAALHQMSTPHARLTHSRAERPVLANSHVVEPQPVWTSPTKERHLWVKVAGEAQAKSSAELEAARLYLPVAGAANLVAGVVALRPLPMKRERAPQGKTSSKVDRRRRRDPIRPCHS